MNRSCLRITSINAPSSFKGLLQVEVLGDLTVAALGIIQKRQGGQLVAIPMIGLD